MIGYTSIWRLVPRPVEPGSPPNSVPADTIYEEGISNTLLAKRGATTAFIEIDAQFAMTEQQVDAQGRVQTAITLATRRTNLPLQAEDLLIFQGQTRDDEGKLQDSILRKSALDLLETLWREVLGVATA